MSFAQFSSLDRIEQNIMESRKVNTNLKIIYFLVFIYISLFLLSFSFSIIQMPYFDMLNWINDYYNTSYSNLFQYLWLQHTAHRLVTTKFLIFLDLVFFKGALYSIAIINLSFLIISFLIILVLVSKIVIDPTLRCWLITGISLLLFSTSNLENCANPLNTQYLLVCFFAFLSLLLFSLPTIFFKKKGVLSIITFHCSFIFAILASISNSNGLLVWFLLFWIIREAKYNKYIYLITFCWGSLTFFFYLTGYKYAQIPPQTDFLVYDIFEFIIFVFKFHAIPWITVPTLYWPSFFFGMIVFITVVITLFKKMFSRTSLEGVELLTVVMLLFFELSAIMISAGRFRLGELPQRYGIFMFSIHICLFILFFPTISGLLSKKYKFFLYLIIVGCFIQQIYVGISAINRSNKFSEIEKRITAGECGPDILYYFSNDPSWFRSNINLYKKNNIYIFRKK